jgi:hypothetical protein
MSDPKSTDLILRILKRHREALPTEEWDELGAFLQLIDHNQKDAEEQVAKLKLELANSQEAYNRAATQRDQFLGQVRTVEKDRDQLKKHIQGLEMERDGAKLSEASTRFELESERKAFNPNMERVLAKVHQECKALVAERDELKAILAGIEKQVPAAKEALAERDRLLKDLDCLKVAYRRAIAALRANGYVLQDGCDGSVWVPPVRPYTPTLQLDPTMVTEDWVQTFICKLPADKLGLIAQAVNVTLQDYETGERWRKVRVEDKSKQESSAQEKVAEEITKEFLRLFNLWRKS